MRVPQWYGASMAIATNLPRLTIAQARRKLFPLIHQQVKMHPIEIASRDGRDVAVLVSLKDWQALMDARDSGPTIGK